MAAITIDSMQALARRLERLTILAELQARAAGRDEAEVRAIRTNVMKAIPEDAGGLDATKTWATLASNEQDTLHLDLLKAIEVVGRIANPGPVDPHVMSSSYPGNGSVWRVLIVCTSLTLLLLGLVWRGWGDATYSCLQVNDAIAVAKQTETNKRGEAARLRADAQAAGAALDRLKAESSAQQKSADEIGKGVEVVKQRIASANDNVRKAKSQDVDQAMTTMALASRQIAEAQFEANRILGIVTPAPTEDDARKDSEAPAVIPASGASNPPVNGTPNHDPVTPSVPMPEPAEEPSSPAQVAIDAANSVTAAVAKLRQLSLTLEVLDATGKLTALTSQLEMLTNFEEQANAAAEKAWAEWEGANRGVQSQLERARQLESEAGELAIEWHRKEGSIGENGTCPPTETALIQMVILVGGLGGCLRLIASLVTYIGNRELRKSWLPFYWLMPLQGAALATIVYFVVRSGVLSGTVTESNEIDQLNLFNIYLYAGMAGMFAKDVTAKLRELLATLFETKQKERDPLGSTPTPTVTTVTVPAPTSNADADAGQ